MSRYIGANNLAYRKKSSTSSLDLLWLSVRNRATGNPERVGFCSDEIGRVIEVRDPKTGTIESRSFYGAGGLVSISEIASTLSIAVQTVEITLSGFDNLVMQAFRQYDAKLGGVEIFIAQLDPQTNEPVEAAECRFFGFINDVEVLTPEEGGVGHCLITATSQTQEMVRYNPDVRSDASQRELRDIADSFFTDAASVGTWKHYWGKKSG